MHKIENVKGWNGREWTASLRGAWGFENRPPVWAQGAIRARGKMLPDWVRISNGMFWFLFLDYL